VFGFTLKGTPLFQLRPFHNFWSYLTKFELENNGKPWRYMLVPHDVIDPSKSFEGLAKKYG
jgi:hypothetical protein